MLLPKLGGSRLLPPWDFPHLYVRVTLWTTTAFHLDTPSITPDPSPVAKALVVPESIRLLRLPAYAPELNPQEHVWDELREKEFPNRVFADLASVTGQLERGLPKLAADYQRLRGITAWPWIVSLNLNAN